MSTKPKDTPETDAWINEKNEKGYSVWAESVRLARKLERERDKYEEALVNISLLEDDEHEVALSIAKEAIGANSPQSITRWL